MKTRTTHSAPAKETLIAVDTGGTFTDFYCVTPQEVLTHKVLSTPRDPSRAILKGLRALDLDYSEIIHGSTVATNALLEHKGARVLLITTRGFEDIIEIGRQQRDRLYDIFVERVSTLVTKSDRVGIDERMGSDGKALTPLRQTELRRLKKQIQGTRASSIAVCLLNAYANDKHERQIATVLKPLKKNISISSQICPEFREYERTTTTCANAYVAPIMSRYLGHLSNAINPPSPPFHKGGKPKIPIRIMQSNGGSLEIKEAAEESVRTLLSGPAGGALGALLAGKQSRFDKLVALDMGGTSTDLTLIDRKIELTSEALLGGYPIKTPMIRIHTIGAGGGSIARVDAGGALQVGPESAGADPGPACYGQGGRDCTITDAHLALGRIHKDYFLGGQMQLNDKKVQAPLQRLAQQLKLGVQATADGIIQVANANMARALRVISLERGYDPREFTLVAFGGAGGLHACELADALEIPRVLIPNNPGILSAYGMAYADWIRDYVQTVLLTEQAASRARIDREIAALKRKARQDARAVGHRIKQLRFRAELDIRYAGQSYELRVPDSKDFKRAFARSHKKQFGFTHKRPIEVVNIRLQVRVPQKHRAYSIGRNKLRPYRPKPLGRSKLFWSGKTWPISYYDRATLGPGTKLKGAAVITEFSATTFVPPGWKMECDRIGNLILTNK